MSKYIDADLLREELKELESVIYSEELIGQPMHPYDNGQLHAIKIVKELNEALQPLGVKDGDRVRMIIIKEDKV